MASTVTEVPPAVFLIFYPCWLFDWRKSVTCLSSWLLPQSWNDTIWQGVFSFLTSTAPQQQQQQHPGHGARWQSSQPTVCAACTSPVCHPSQKSLLVNARSVFERQASILLARTCLPIWKTNFQEPLFASPLRQFGDQKHGLSIYLRESKAWSSADKVETKFSKEHTFYLPLFSVAWLDQKLQHCSTHEQYHGGGRWLCKSSSMLHRWPVYYPWQLGTWSAAFHGSTQGVSFCSHSRDELCRFGSGEPQDFMCFKFPPQYFLSCIVRS